MNGPIRPPLTFGDWAHRVPEVLNLVGRRTVLGGSRMSPAALEAMRKAAHSYRHMSELHTEAGRVIAALCRVPAATVVNGAAAGLMVTAAAAARRATRSLSPRGTGASSDARQALAIHRIHRNPLDRAVEVGGCDLVEFGNVVATTNDQLSTALGPEVIGVLYVCGSYYARGALRLDEVAVVAARHNLPLIVDAALEVPPVENLWRLYEAGASAVVFSGGKEIRGPQSSGFIVGDEEFVGECRMVGFPFGDLGRHAKVGKEEVAGLVTALGEFVADDHESNRRQARARLETLWSMLQFRGVDCRIDDCEYYPRLQVEVARTPGWDVRSFLERWSPSIAVDYVQGVPGILLTLHCLDDAELEVCYKEVPEAFRSLVAADADTDRGAR